MRPNPPGHDRLMLRPRVPCLLFVFAVIAACAPREPAYDLLDGGEIRFSDMAGSVVLINYWAEWCRPCRIEIPELNEFAHEYAGRALVYSVNFDGLEGAALRRQAEDLGIAFPTLLQDPRQRFNLEPAKALPETLVIDQGGNLHKVLVGPQTKAGLAQLLADMNRPEPPIAGSTPPQSQ